MKRRLQCRSRKAARVWATGETVDTLLSGSSPSRFESGVAYQIRSRLAERSGTGDDGEGHPAGYVGSNPTPGNGEKAMPTVSPKERDTAASHRWKQHASRRSISDPAAIDAGRVEEQKAFHPVAAVMAPEASRPRYCPPGGTGRRGGLKNRCLVRAGSSPAVGTRNSN